MKFLKPSLILLLFCLACKNDQADAPESSAEINPVTTTNTEEEIINTAPMKMVTNIDNLRMRAKAGEQGQEIGRLKKGTALQGLGEVSDFTTKIQLRGIWFDEPWLKVKTEQGMEGWIYSGAVNFDLKNPTALSKRLVDKRLGAFFGKGLSEEINQYRDQFNDLKTSQEFADNYRAGTTLKDSLVSIMENKIPVPENYDQMPDLFWLEEAIPGYVTQLVAEGTIYHLFKDFKELKEKSLVTQGTEDDEFIDLNLIVHSADSIEYFFPSWFIQTWDYGGSSLLGQGVHLKVLQKLEKVLNKSDLFIEEALTIKDLLISDMTNADINYWEPKHKILKETDAIIAAELNILTNEDKVALETRRKQFENPDANNIRVNHRTGE